MRSSVPAKITEPPKLKSVIRVRELVSELREMPYEDQTKRNKLWSELRGEVSYLLLDGFSESWEQDLFNGTITPSKRQPDRFL